MVSVRPLKTWRWEVHEDKQLQLCETSGRPHPLFQAWNRRAAPWCVWAQQEISILLKTSAGTWSSADSESDVLIKGQEHHKTRSSSAWQEDTRQPLWPGSPLHLPGGKPSLSLKKKHLDGKSDWIWFNSTPLLFIEQISQSARCCLLARC